VTQRDVFVSYSHPDRDCAHHLVAQLEKDGISTWIAPRDITPAAEWAAEIINAISEARLMVLVFSEHCNDSPQVLREVERATHKHIPVLPFRVQHVLPTNSLEYFLSARHWFDALPTPLPSHYVRLSRHITALLNGSVTIRTALSTRTDLSQSSTGANPRLVVPNTFTDAELAAVRRHLAQHVGPIAKHLVQRAAVKASDLAELARLLADEIGPAAERQKFLDVCGRSPGPDGRAGSGRDGPVAHP
jgi:hypothetical protein